MPKRVLKPGRYAIVPFKRNWHGAGFIRNCAEYANRLAEPQFIAPHMAKPGEIVINVRNRFAGHVVPTQFGLLDAAPSYLITPCESDELCRRPFESESVNWIVVDIEEKVSIELINDSILKLGDLSIQLDQVDMMLGDLPVLAGTPAMTVLEQHLEYSPGEYEAFAWGSAMLYAKLEMVGTPDTLALRKALEAQGGNGIFQIKRESVAETFDADGLAWVRDGKVMAVITPSDPEFGAIKLRSVQDRGSDGREEVCRSSAYPLQAIGSHTANELSFLANTGRLVLHRYYNAPALAA